MSLIRKHGAVLQAWACLDLVNVTLTPASATHYRGFGFTLSRFTGFTQQQDNVHANTESVQCLSL